MQWNIGAMNLLALSAAIFSAAAVAQTPQQHKAPAVGEQRNPTACAQGRATVGANGDAKADNQPGSLSDKLARSNGVICPPEHVDPEIKAPTPQGGTMPVIPPPGSPGGNPSVQPK